VTVPRLISPFVRTRARLAGTLGLLVVALVATLAPWWWHSRVDKDQPAVQAAPAADVPRDEAAAMAEAIRTGKEVLVETATTANSLTWALPTGKMRTAIHATPQRAKDDSGQWAQIDTTLTQGAPDPSGLGIQPVNPPYPVRFAAPAAQGSSEGQKKGSAHAFRLVSATRDESVETVLAEADLDGHTVTYTWPGTLPTPVLDGPRALYPEVLPGVDLLLVARQEGGFGQLLIVKSSASATLEAVRSVAYGLRSKTAVFRHDPVTAGVQILDPVTGQEIGSVPSPFAWDSSGIDPDNPGATPRTAVDTPQDVLKLSGLAGSEPGARNAPIPTRLDGDGTGEARLHLNAGATGLLTAEGVRFPVFLDPTLRGTTLAWATVYKQHPNTNTWNGTNFNSGTSDARVGYETETGLLTRSFWRMPFSKKLHKSVVSKATFRVLNNHSWSCTARQMELYRYGTISSGTTWNKQPSRGELQQAKSFAHGYGSACADEWVAFNVINGAKKLAEASTAASNITFGMKATSEGDHLSWRRFAATSAELEVEYNTKPNEPTKGTTSPGGACVASPGTVTVAKTNIVLAANATDADGNLTALRFAFWKVGDAQPSDTIVTADSSGRASLTIASSRLTDKASYNWAVRAEDTSGALSTWFPPGSEPCRITIDASAPPAPTVSSTVFLEATDDGATWSTVKYGQTGPVTFEAEEATRFTYSMNGLHPVDVPATSGTATVSALRPRHAGPNTLNVYAYDAAGNRSLRTDYTFYVPPGSTADKPGDVNGDEWPDLLLVNASGNLRNFAGDENGEIYTSITASYNSSQLNPKHWHNTTTGSTALITKYGDAYPGDGLTDLFVRTPDGRFWLYPGDGYGSFDTDQRLEVRLPVDAPAPSTWTQIKAIGDITGDGHPDLVLRAGISYWVLSGYTGASFQQATQMNHNAWGRREIVHLADMDLDGTPDLLWRHLDNGNLYIRHGKPGPVAGSVNLDSLKVAADSRDGVDALYGSGFTEAAVNAVLGMPDVNRDGIPDIYSRSATNGNIRVHYPSQTALGSSMRTVISTDWSSVKTFG